jgi:hypothetical protein
MKVLFRLLIACLTFVIGINATSLRALLWHSPKPVHATSLSNPVNKSELAADSEDRLAYEQGAYSNIEYGYSVTIPDGLTGYRSAPPMPQHGFGIDLYKPDNAQVWVDGSYNALEWGSLDEAANETLRYLKDDDVSNIRVTRRRYDRLSTLRAVRIEVSYQKAGRSMIDDEIIAFRQERDIVYTLQLTTTSARYSEDVKVLNQLQKTFRLNALPYP